jgi:hypothetical protein
MLLNILKHPIATHVVLVASCDTEEATMVCDYSAAELRDVALEIHQVLRLLSRVDIIEVDVFVSPLEVVNYSLVGQLLLQNENVSEEV